MTISYSGNFARLLLRWKGSVWKTTWKELMAFLFCYYMVRIIYHHALTNYQKDVFEKLIVEFDDYTKRIPLTFLLGFYVATVVKRWWDQFQYIAWPDSCLQSLCYCMPVLINDDNDTITRRRTVARYLNLCSCLAYRDLSARVRKRFLSLEHLVKAELMTEDELAIYQQSDDWARWCLPLQWAQDLVEEYARIHSVSAPYVVQFLSRMYDFRSSFHKLFCYDWVSLPLVYTQVTALATYGYFIMCLIGRQFIENRSQIMSDQNLIASNFSSIDCNRFCNDYYIPIFSILEFVFYVGWFKVGQDILRPFEEDDDDFELNYILDRNIKVSALIVNSYVSQRPPFPPNAPLSMWENAKVAEIPYTKLCKPDFNHPPKMHAYVKIKNTQDSQPLADEKHEEKLAKKALRRQQTKRWRYF